MIVAATLCVLSSACGLLAQEQVVQASKLALRTAGVALSDGGWNLTTNGDLGQWVSIEGPGKASIRVRAGGSELKGVWPEVELVVVVESGGRMVPAFRKVFAITKARYEDYRFEMELKPGLALVRLRFQNDAVDKKTGGDRNLFVREFGLTGVKVADAAPAWWYPFGKKAEKLRAMTDAAIAKHRMGKLVVRTSKGAVVKVEQVAHEFAFGTAVATRYFSKPFTVESRAYVRLLTENFNAVVAENAMKWPQSEPAHGHERWDDMDRMLRFCLSKDMQARGHCLFWAVPKRVPAWVKRLDKTALLQVVDERAWRTTARFNGRIDEFDVNNEMLAGHWYRKHLGADIVARMFTTAASGHPKARFYVNEYDILTPGNRVFAYGHLIRDLQKRKAPVGGIGCQAHFNVRPDANQVKRVLDYLSSFDLPITITEYDFGRGNEEEKAQVLHALLRVCFAHPTVQGFYQWGFWSGAHWKPERALWGKDGEPTRAAEVYRDLVYRQWWTRFEGPADDRGFVTVPAFFGKHRVSVGTKSKLVTLARGQSSLQVSF